MVKNTNPILGECEEMLLGGLSCRTVVTLNVIVLHVQCAGIWCLCRCACSRHNVPPSCEPQRGHHCSLSYQQQCSSVCAPRPLLLIRNEKPVLFKRLILCQHDTFINTPGHHSLRDAPLLLMGLVLRHIQWLL